jgi:SpoVK/Ycf46/Vps4 family AAA+-type ATPase
MQCLDSFDCGTIVLGATNREDMIDPALKRRFALHHQMNLPSKDIRVSIAKRYLESIPDAEYSEDDIENFANITEGYSCAKIVNLLVGQVVDCLTKNKKITLSGINLRRESQ